VIPPSRLHFFNVKEGWEPLCKILDLPVPDMPFPHANDKDAVQEFMIGFMKKAVWKWLEIFAVGAVVVGAVWWVRKM
jgi:hypothetical protein